MCRCGVRNVIGAANCYRCGTAKPAPVPPPVGVVPRPAGSPPAPAAGGAAPTQLQMQAPPQPPSNQHARCWGWFWKSLLIGSLCTGIVSMMIGFIQAFSPVPEDKELAGYTFAGMLGSVLIHVLVSLVVTAVMSSMLLASIASFLQPFLDALGGGSPLNRSPSFDFNAPF